MWNYSWNGARPSQLPRMLDAPVVMDGALVVDGRSIDGAPTPQVTAILAAAKGPAESRDRRLAELGVGWVVTEHPDGRVVAEALPDPGPYPSPSRAAWAAAWSAHALWLGCLLAGVAGAASASRRTRAKSPAVDAQE